eukprot:Opistho-2@74852
MTQPHVEKLTPFGKLPSVSGGLSAAVLVFGPPFVGRKSLGRRMIEVSKNVAVQIRTSAVMPLPEDSTGTRPRIEYAVVMVDATNRHSLDMASAALRQLGHHYFTGRCCIVVTRVDKPSHYAIELAEVDALADVFDIPVYYCDGSNDAQRSSVAGRIITSLEVALRLRQGVTPLVLRSTDHAMVASTIIQ